MVRVAALLLAVVAGMWLQHRFRLADLPINPARAETAERETATPDMAGHDTRIHDAASHPAAGHDPASHEMTSPEGGGHDATTHGAASHPAAGHDPASHGMTSQEAAGHDPGSHDMATRSAAVPGDSADAGSAGTAAAEAVVVRIAPEVVNSLGVRTARAELGALQRRVDSGGFVAYDESRITRLHATAPGRVGRLLVTTPGRRVKAGEPVIEIESHDGQTVSVTAPVEGLVAEVGEVYRGMEIGAGTEIMKLVDASTVWVKGEIFESDGGWLYIGQPVEARFPERPGEVWKGAVEIILPKVEYANRTIRYRVRFDNPDGFLLPNTFAELTFYGRSGKEVVHIPRQALIREGEAERVIVSLGNGRFAPRVVTAGAEFGERLEIRSGLQAGEEVVTSAQFLIDSEASLQASMGRLDGGAPSTHHHH